MSIVFSTFVMGPKYSGSESRMWGCAGTPVLR